jgi:hypothetical protein
MKLMIITVLIMMLIWGGCKSFFPINEKQHINLRDYGSKDIRLDLVDGTEITSMAYTHKLVTKPSNFIMGLGTLTYEGQTNNKKTFYSYNANEFDSVKSAKINGKDYVTCYLKSGVQIHYEDDSYLKVSPKDGTGYFIMGVVEKGGIKNIKMSLVELNKIKDVEIQKADGLKIAGGIILTLGIFVVLVATNFSLGGRRYYY